MACLSPLICMWTTHTEAAGKITWLQNTVATQDNTDVFHVYIWNTDVCIHSSDWLQETWRKPNFSQVWWGPWERIYVEGRNITVHLMLQGVSKFKGSGSAFLEIHSAVPNPWWHMGGQRERLLCWSNENHFIKFCYTLGYKHSSEGGEVG